MLIRKTYYIHLSLTTAIRFTNPQSIVNEIIRCEPNVSADIGTEVYMLASLISDSLQTLLPSNHNGINIEMLREFYQNTSKIYNDFASKSHPFNIPKSPFFNCVLLELNKNMDQSIIEISRAPINLFGTHRHDLFARHCIRKDCEYFPTSYEFATPYLKLGVTKRQCDDHSTSGYFLSIGVVDLTKNAERKSVNQSVKRGTDGQSTQSHTN